jgi:adenylate cyclase
LDRRLAAILAADVVGYSRLMEADEAGTLSTLKFRRAQILDPLVRKHHGRIIKLMGDGALVEFGSAVNAVACAVELQNAMRMANANLPRDKQIVLRIGINLGDVIVEGNDLYGEGVNIASRLEAIAEPGGIFVSRKVFDETRRKLDVTFDDVGHQRLKNISEAVHAYRVDMVRDGTESVQSDRHGAALELLRKPSIAVLPFANMSSDAEQEYFADGMTEDIITELSRFRSLFVIARNSSFHYKGKVPIAQQVGRELGVHWIVEGSVRKVGARLRITAQLVDAAGGAHIWAERYDRPLDNVFDIQDEVVRSIVGTIPERLDRVAVEQSRRKPPANLTAFDYLLRARWSIRHTTDGLQRGIEYLEKAIESDPRYASAHALLSFAYSYGMHALGHNPDIAIERARFHAVTAVSLEGEDNEVNAAAAIGYLLSGDYEQADAHSERAIAINANDPGTLFSRGLVLAYLGRQPAAMDCFVWMERVDPFAPDDSRSEGLCDSLYMQRMYEKLTAITRRWQAMPPHYHLIEAAAHAQLGEFDAAAASVGKFRQHLGPKPDPKALIGLQMRMLAREEDREHWLEGYRKAGLEV